MESWRELTITLRSGTDRFLVTGIRGNQDESDIAIDDIEVQSGSCPSKKFNLYTISTNFT